MRIIFLIGATLSVLLSTKSLSSAFIVSPSFSGRRIASAVFSTADVEEADVISAREELMEITRDLNSRYGILPTDSTEKESFRDAVEKLENLAQPSSDASLLVGDWTLLCSYSNNSAFPENKKIIDTSKIPLFNQGPIKDIQDTLNGSIKVEQRIKFGESSNSIDAIDHVIEYKPPNTLSSFLKNAPDIIKDLDINPLKVIDYKIVLKHTAEIEGLIPNIKTKLNLKSVVVNVAGESQILDPSGEDVLGINIPFSEYFGAGSFETTFLNESMRVSRSKVGPVEQIRVFIKADDQAVASVVEEDDDDDELADDDDDDDDELADDSIVDADVVVESDDEETTNDDSDKVDAPSDIEN